MKDRFYRLLFIFGEWLEYEVAFWFQNKALNYWRDYCKYCGMEGGYGHKKGCPRLDDE